MAKPRRPAPVSAIDTNDRDQRARAHRRRAGGWTWLTQRQIQGVRHTRTLRGPGGDTVLTRAQAQRALQVLLEGGWPWSEMQAEAPAGGAVVQTLRDLVEYYLGHQDARVSSGSIAPRTRHLAGRDLRRLGELLDAELIEVNDHTIRAWLAVALQRWSARTLTQTLVYLGAAWSWGRSELGLPLAALQIPRLRLEPVERREPTAGDVAAMIAWCEAQVRANPSRTSSIWTGRLVYLSWITGARIGDLARLRWADVDLAAGVITIRAQKNRRLLRVPIEAAAVARIATWEQAGDRVLRVSVQTVKGAAPRRMAEAADGAGVPRWTPHGARRALVHRLIGAGVDAKTASQITGHSVGVLLRDYYHPTADDLRAAIEAAGGADLPRGRVVPFPTREQS